MRERKFRNKITWFSFVFTLLVVWIHACNAELFLGTGEAAARLNEFERFVADAIGQIAVPGFFMISGYLFFRNFTFSRLEEKWTRRIKSTLTPYILWNFLYYLGYVAASRLPGLEQVVGKGAIGFNLEELVNAVLHYKYNPVFWYMFQLILLILLAPVIYLFIRYFRGRVLFFAVLGILLAGDIHLPFLNTDALFYYSIAGASALSERTCKAVETPYSGGSRSVLSITALLAAVVFYLAGMKTYVPVCFVICRTLVVGGLWFLIPAEPLRQAGKLVSEHFFLYATHFALVRLINKSAAILLPAALHVPAVPLVIFLIMPFLTLAISTVVYAVLHCLLPRLCLLLNGGRE